MVSHFPSTLMFCGVIYEAVTPSQHAFKNCLYNFLWKDVYHHKLFTHTLLDNGMFRREQWRRETSNWCRWWTNVCTCAPIHLSCPRSQRALWLCFRNILSWGKGLVAQGNIHLIQLNHTQQSKGLCSKNSRPPGLSGFSGYMQENHTMALVYEAGCFQTRLATRFETKLTHVGRWMQLLWNELLFWLSRGDRLIDLCCFQSQELSWIVGKRTEWNS